METMTQNTLADLRSMEHAVEDKKDRYLLGLCTLFVATIEDAKDRVSQLELVFCSQLFPAFQAKLLESRQALQHAEDLHRQSLQDFESSREDLLRDIQNLRADREKETMRSNFSSEIDGLHQELQELLHEKQLRTQEASKCKLQLEEQTLLYKRVSNEIEELQQELLRLRKEKDVQGQKDLCRNLNEQDEMALQTPQTGSLQIEFDKLSEEAVELRQSNRKLLQENQDIHQQCAKLSSEVGLLKSKMLLSPSEVSPTEAETDKSLQLKLEQKSQERSLESFRRQLISTEVEKEKRATNAALVKLHTLKKRYQSLRKQYTVLFRHSHLLEHQKQAVCVITCENQEKFGLGDGEVERYSNTNMNELKAKCNCAKPRTYTPTPSNFKARDSPEYSADLAHQEKPNHLSVMEAARQGSKETELTNTTIPQKEVNNMAAIESPEISDSSQSPHGAEERGAVKSNKTEKEDRVLNTPDKLNQSENNFTLEKFLKLQKDLPPIKSWDQEFHCNMLAHLDKASQVGSRNVSFLKDDFNFGANADELAERTESSNSGDNPSEDVQGNMIEEPGPQRSAGNGWCPIQKRGLSSKCHPKASKSVKTTWRNTRSRAEVNGFDPHDDFLDTPHENAVKSHADQARNDNQGMIAPHQSGTGTNISEDNLRPRCKPEQLADYGRKDVSFSQITTQAPDQEVNFTYGANQNEKHVKEQVGFHQPSGSRNNLLRLPKKHGLYTQQLGDDSKNKDFCSATNKRNTVLPVSKQGPMYKYVEPVRKKDERAALQGVECNQCKKFYDAVLQNNGPGATSVRCEHHDFTSRHRYRYMPPSTPEGFWNIGFDSEL